jgi:hypothetical protein
LGDYRVHPGQMSGALTFSTERHADMTKDEILRYAAVNSVLAKFGGPKLDPLRWSIHTLNRQFMRRLDLSDESVLPLLWRHVTANMRSDRRFLSKGKSIGFR